MATFAQNNVQYLLIGKSGNVTTAATSINDLADGEIGIFTPGGTKMTEAAADKGVDFVIAQGKASGTPPFVSEVLISDNFKRKNKKATSAAVEQRDYIGYDTSANSIDAQDDTTYRVSIALTQDYTGNHGGIYIKDGVYKSDSTAAQSEIALGLAKSVNNNFNREAERALVADAVTDSTTTAITGTGTLTIAKGSKYLEAGTDIDAVLAVDDFIRLDESGGGAPATSDPVFKIVELDTTNNVATLDREYRGSALSAVAEANGVQITAADGAAGDWGVRLEGQSLSFEAGKISYKKASWDLSLNDGFGSTTTTSSTAADPGIGVEEQIKELEWFIKGNEGEFYRMGQPLLHSFTSQVESGASYDLIDLEFTSKVERGYGAIHSPRRYTLAVHSTTPDWASSLADDVTDVLEKLLVGSVDGSLAI